MGHGEVDRLARAPPIRAIRSWPRLTRWLTATRAAAASSMDTQETPGPGTPTEPMGTPRAPSCSISASSMGRVRTSTPSTRRRRGIRAKKLRPRWPRRAARTAARRTRPRAAPPRPGQDLAEEPPTKVGRDHADRVGLPTGQARGARRDHVVQLPCGGQDPGPGVCRHVRQAAQGPGDRRRGHPGQARHCLDIRGPAPRPPVVQMSVSRHMDTSANAVWIDHDANAIMQAFSRKRLSSSASVCSSVDLDHTL